MSSSINLDRDFSQFSTFIASAQEKYPQVNVKQVVSNCTDGSWKVVKHGFVENDGKFLGAEMARVLEAAIQRQLPQAEPAAFIAPERVVEKPRSYLCPVLAAAAVAIAAVGYAFAQSI